MAKSTDGKSSVNVKRLTMWKLATDSESGTTYESDTKVFTNELNSARYTPKVQTASQYGDGIKVEDYVAKDGGDIEITIRGFKEGDSEFLFGETATTDGTEVSGADDIVPYVSVAYMTERPDGLVNLYKFPKTKWMPQGETANQKEGSAVNYGTANLQGTYSPLLSTEKDMYRRYGVDPDTDKEFIESWFSKPDFYTAAASD